MQNNLQYHSLSDTGLKRPHNEDYILQTELENGFALVLCDGMGGHAKGEVASDLACKTAINYLKENQDKPSLWMLEDCINHVNQTVFEKAQEDESTFGMGTTIVIAFIKDGFLFHTHIGDSRMYLLREGKLKQLTSDHSYVNELVKAGVITKEEAIEHPKRNQITQAIGLKSTVNIDVCKEPIPLHKDDLILLCSDGLTDMVKDDRISEIINQEISTEEKAQSLVDEANKNGGKDNITVGLIKNNTEIINTTQNSNKTRWFVILIVIILIGCILFFEYSKPELYMRFKDSIWPGKNLI